MHDGQPIHLKSPKIVRPVMWLGQFLQIQGRLKKSHLCYSKERKLWGSQTNMIKLCKLNHWNLIVSFYKVIIDLTCSYLVNFWQLVMGDMSSHFKIGLSASVLLKCFLQFYFCYQLLPCLLSCKIYRLHLLLLNCAIYN